MSVAAEAPRAAREALRAFGRLQAELDAATAACSDDAPPETQARAVFTALRRALIGLGAPETPPPNAESRPVDAAYVLTSSADEALLHRTRWRGAAVWPDMLLERALYGGELAGERVVEAARAAVDGRAAPRRDVSAALYVAFATGFQGGLRGAPGAEAEAARLTAGLYDLAMERPAPTTLDLRSRFQQAAAHTAPTPRRPRPRLVERAAAALGLVIVAYLGVSHLIWSQTHAEVSRLVDSVIALSRNGG